MAANTSIEWTTMTWNPITGCTKTSQGCKNCYAERMAKRLQAMGMLRYRNGFEVTLHSDLISLPFTWKRPRLIFVNSMSDLFHQNVPLEFIQQVFETMAICGHHIFQVLTKRSQRLTEIAHRLPWSPNIWMGVTVENRRAMRRVEHLQQVPAAIRFISCEPLLEQIDNLPLKDIHWTIVGGESGPKARPMQPAWVKSLLQQCREARVPFFFKQWGGTRKKVRGRKLNGRTYEEMPHFLPNETTVSTAPQFSSVASAV